jgi:hypothetical protein
VRILGKKAVLGTILFSMMSVVPQGASACGRDGKTGYLPANGLDIPPRRTVYNRKGEPISGGLTHEEFDGVITSVERIYGPIVQQMGGDLKIERNWDDGTVNAYATRPDEKPTDWIVAMFGGLARHKEVTIDGFLLVVCHELGHHIGGAPKYDRGNADEWAGNEGEADYFATLKCARRVLERENNVAEVATLYVPDSVRRRCESNFRNDNEAAICIRSSLAGLSLARLLASLSDENLPEDRMPWFGRWDLNRVGSMYDEHPEAQCRLDTYYAGALCGADFRDDVDQKDPLVGTCSSEMGHSVGVRPRCWYYPTGATDSRTRSRDRDPGRPTRDEIYW